MVGLDDHEGLFQPRWFCDYVITNCHLPSLVKLGSFLLNLVQSLYRDAEYLELGWAVCCTEGCLEKVPAEQGEACAERHGSRWQNTTLTRQWEGKHSNVILGSWGTVVHQLKPLRGETWSSHPCTYTNFWILLSLNCDSPYDESNN